MENSESPNPFKIVPVEILVGQATEQAEKVKQLVGERKAIYITKDRFRPSNIGQRYLFSDVFADTEVIVFENVPQQHLKPLLNHVAYVREITVDKINQRMFVMNRPAIIITSDGVGEIPTITKPAMLRRFRVTDLSKRQTNWKTIEDHGEPSNATRTGFGHSTPYVPCLVYSCHPDALRSGIVETCQWDTKNHCWEINTVQSKPGLSPPCIITHYMDDATNPYGDPV